MHWLQESIILGPFLEVNRCSAVSVDPPDNRQQVQFIGEVPMLTQEGPEVHRVDGPTIVLIY